MGNERGRGRRKQDWFGGDGRSGNFAGSGDRGYSGDRNGGRQGGDRRDDQGPPRDDRRDDRRDYRRDDGPGRDRNRPARDTSREVVVPGDLLAHGVSIGGPGTFTDKGIVFAAQLGVRTFYDGKVSVLPLGGRYMPIIGDEVIGRVQDVNPNFWLVDINAPYPAPLHIDESAWQVPIGETDKYLTRGDIILVKVQSVDLVKRSKLTMRDGRSLRKLVGGMTLEVAPSKVPRIIGKGGSMISLIKDRTGCGILVGQNGRVWIDGEPAMMVVASEAIDLIDRNAQQSGLTDSVEAFLDDRTGRRR